MTFGRVCWRKVTLAAMKDEWQLQKLKTLFQTQGTSQGREGDGQDQTEVALRAGSATKCVAGAMPERAEDALEHGRKTS